MSHSPSKILQALATKQLKWHITDKPGYFICEEQSGKKTFLTPADLFRIDPRLPPTLQWYSTRYSPEQTGDLLQKTMGYWLAPFHLAWSAPGLSSPFCLLTNVLRIEHYSPSTGHFKLKGVGVGLRHCQGHQIVVEHTTGTMTYAIDSLKAHIPGFEKRLQFAKTQPTSNWLDILFKAGAPSKAPSLPDDVAAAYDGLLY